eukprot:COSAG04_NODE_257_length_18753_cov_7.516857_10_plen_177_part_00
MPAPSKDFLGVSLNKRWLGLTDGAGASGRLGSVNIARGVERHSAAGQRWGKANGDVREPGAAAVDDDEEGLHLVARGVQRQRAGAARVGLRRAGLGQRRLQHGHRAFVLVVHDQAGAPKIRVRPGALHSRRGQTRRRQRREQEPRCPHLSAAGQNRCSRPRERGAGVGWAGGRGGG